MKLLLLAATVAFTIPMRAQIACSDFVRTYEFAHTRGFFFQAPTDFTVHALQVPDETKKGQYHVAIYRTATRPWMLSSITPVFLATAVKSGSLAMVRPAQSFKKGEWFGVLGAAGPNSGSLANSYGANGPFPSRVLGLPVMLERMMHQSNLAVSKGVGPVYSASGLSISRVRVYVVGHGQALPYGSGGVAKSGSLLVADNAPPSIGRTGSMVAVPGDPGHFVAALFLGSTRVLVPTPFGNLLTPPLVLLPLGKLPTNGMKIDLAIPNRSTLLGSNVFFQFAELQGSSWALSNGMHWIVDR